MNSGDTSNYICEYKAKRENGGTIGEIFKIAKFLANSQFFPFFLTIGNIRLFCSTYKMASRTTNLDGGPPVVRRSPVSDL